MTLFSGKYPTVTKSFKVLSMTMEGTQLQVVIVLGGMVKGQPKRQKIIYQLKMVDKIASEQVQCMFRMAA